jgi:hypothetical protein
MEVNLAVLTAPDGWWRIPDRIRRRFNYYRYRNRLEDHKFLFLLCPPYSGSTLIKEIVESSTEVSSFPFEGQSLPGARPLMLLKDRFDPGLDLQWGAIRRVFLRNWDLGRSILFEKSPPNLVRADRIAETFNPAYFIISIRNPYAMIEGYLRRRTEINPEQASELWVHCARFQAKNRKSLKHQVFFSFEELTEQPDAVLGRLRQFLPELSGLGVDRVFMAKNSSGRPLHGVRNLNAEKIARLAPEVIQRINTVLGPNLDIVREFGYELIE